MLKGKPYNGLKSDVWSVGIILYAMCFGYLPFDNPNTAQLYKSISDGEY
jgi:5'-AMP-activated protein kinase catalytic alpha subunit